MEFAFGFLGITPDVYDDMTIREFVNASRGYWKRYEIGELQDNYRARSIAYNIYCSTPKKGNNININAFWPLDKRDEFDKKRLEEAKKKFKKQICLPELQ